MCQTNRLDTSPSCFYRVFMIRNSVLIFLISFVAYGCATSHKNSHSQLVRGYIERGDYSFTTSLVKNENCQKVAVDRNIFHSHILYYDKTPPMEFKNTVKYEVYPYPY